MHLLVVLLVLSMLLPVWVRAVWLDMVFLQGALRISLPLVVHLLFCPFETRRRKS